jgi:hypothetical protein
MSYDLNCVHVNPETSLFNKCEALFLIVKRKNLGNVLNFDLFYNNKTIYVFFAIGK